MQANAERWEKQERNGYVYIDEVGYDEKVVLLESFNI